MTKSSDNIQQPTDKEALDISYLNEFNNYNEEFKLKMVKKAIGVGYTKLGIYCLFKNKFKPTSV